MGKKRTHKKGSKTKSRSVKRRTKSRSVKRRTKSRSSGKRERKRQTSKKVMKGGGKIKIMELKETFKCSHYDDKWKGTVNTHYWKQGKKGETYCVFEIRRKHLHYGINITKYTNKPGNTYKEFTYAIRYYPNTVCPDYGSNDNMNKFYDNMNKFYEENNTYYGPEPKLIPTDLLSDI